MLSWLKSHWRLLKQGEVWSIDCTFTGHRLQTYKSYSPANAPPPRLGDGISRFTNLVVTALSSTGRYHESILFTFNQAFRRDRNPTPNRVAEVAYLDRVLKEYNVKSRRCVYVGKPKKEKRTCVAATPDILAQYLALIEVEPEHVWLSDNGKEFFTSEGSSLASRVAKHLPYPAAVHQYLSPNDNNHHSAAKARWRAMGLDYMDDVRASVALLFCLDSDAEHIAGYFQKNMQLNKAHPELGGVTAIIGGEASSNSSYFEDCRYDYCIAFRKDGRGTVERDTNDGLDGKHWQ